MVKYNCPYCNTDKVIVYEKYFQCRICKSKFDKLNFDSFEDKSDLLSINELKGIAKVLKKHKSGNKDLRKLFEGPNEESNDF